MSSFATVYPLLADRLAAEIPGIGWIDLDQGQLTPDGQLQEYALPFHDGVVLLDFDEADWHDIGQGIQRGDAIVRVTLAVQVVADSYQCSSQRSQALAKLQLLGEIHKALQHFDGGGDFGALVRTYSRKEQSELPAIWQYSMGYKVLLTDTEGYDGATSTVSGLEPRPEAAFVLP
ncbi:hypothetical protein Q5H93_21665 [Hymenobacter sp. ASUV-10]|uniref:Uncharacterized protein n=1 Tax=Hymenobacter aranciens TaxID=3063996 RepID=A0ABT9BGH8_9BACT|nr:hypothetical protein [Hymenobacter sp. ASUV-10]MDO7877364.1 hypothetical protein [Hymenobacter sp. ASUV-10]